MTDGRDQYEALIHRYFLAVDEERIDDAVACFCEDGTLSFPLLESPISGHEELRAFFSDHVSRFDTHVDRATRVLIDGDRAISELVFDARTTDGRTVHLENCNVYRFRDGRFAAVQIYADSVELRRQFGEG